MAAAKAVPPATGAINILVGGFGSSAAAYEDLRAEMERASGTTTIFVPPTRWGLILFKGKKPYPRVLYRQALYIARRLRRAGVRTVRLYGHSMGGAVVMILADAFSETLEIEKVVALNPACVHVDGVLPLARRMVGKVKSDVHSLKHHPSEDVQRLIRAGRPGALLYAANLGRTVAEGLVLARTRLFEQLKPSLDSKNIKLMVGYADEDSVFLATHMRAALAGMPAGSVFLLEHTTHDVQLYSVQTVAALKRHGAL